MKSIGFKAGVEWLEGEVETRLISSVAQGDEARLIEWSRSQGIELRRFGDVEGKPGRVWVQGPRL